MKLIATLLFGALTVLSGEAAHLRDIGHDLKNQKPQYKIRVWTVGHQLRQPEPGYVDLNGGRVYPTTTDINGDIFNSPPYWQYPQYEQFEDHYKKDS